jgi:hypothetical protein
MIPNSGGAHTIVFLLNGEKCTAAQTGPHMQSGLNTKQEKPKKIKPLFHQPSAAHARDTTRAGEVSATSR